MSKPSPSDIAKHAYHIWEREGRPHGRDQDHWYAAEHELGGNPPAKSEPAAEDRVNAAQVSSRQTASAGLGRPAHPSSPSTTQAAAATGKRSQQAPGSQPEPKSAQVQAGQPSGAKAQQPSGSAQAEPAAGGKPQGAGARKPRGPRQPSP